MNTFRFLRFAASGRRTAVRNSYGSALAHSAQIILPKYCPPTYFGPNTSAQIVPQITSAQILPPKNYLHKYCRPKYFPPNLSTQIILTKYLCPNTSPQKLRPNTSAQHTSAQILHPKYFCQSNAIHCGTQNCAFSLQNLKFECFCAHNFIFCKKNTLCHGCNFAILQNKIVQIVNICT